MGRQLALVDVIGEYKITKNGQDVILKPIK
jgi:hypothetical protein